MRYKKQSHLPWPVRTEFCPKPLSLCREHPWIIKRTSRTNKPGLGLLPFVIYNSDAEPLMCTQITGILLKCRYCLNMSGVGPQFCISNKLSSDADAVGLRTRLWEDLRKWGRKARIMPFFGRFSHWIFGPFEIRVIIDKFRLAPLNTTQRSATTESSCPVPNE